MYKWFFLIWVLWPFQEYFTYIEPIVNQRWGKTGVPGEKPPDLPVQNLDVQMRSKAFAWNEINSWTPQFTQKLLLKQRICSLGNNSHFGSHFPFSKVDLFLKTSVCPAPINIVNQGKQLNLPNYGFKKPCCKTESRFSKAAQALTWRGLNEITFYILQNLLYISVIH